jgi:MerR family mercuric resistance operon transcriptional regulator
MYLKDDKLIRLSKLAEITGVSIHCIRAYLDRGLIQASERTQSGYYLFSRPALERLQFIRSARDAGVPLEQIARLLAASDGRDNKATTFSLKELAHYIEESRNRLNHFEQSLRQHFVT